MGFLELATKYKKHKTRQVVNAAIRAEIPGGSAVLDLLDFAHKLSTTSSRPEFKEIFSRVQGIRAEMQSSIGEKYGVEFQDKGKANGNDE